MTHDSPSAPLLEIFPSIQGEGSLAGTPQVFVRLGRCNIVCNYCDTPESIGEPPPRMTHQRAVGGAREELENPLGVEAVERLVMETVAATPAIRSASITGGEPLLHASFLGELLPRLRAGGLATLLETNGLLAGAMERLAPHIDVASVDVKLPGETGLAPDVLARKHADFLRATAGCGDTYCKLVLTATSPDQELAAARDTIAGVSPSIVTFITPVTQVEGGPGPPPLERLLAAAALLGERLADVRVLPQVHSLAAWR